MKIADEIREALKRFMSDDEADASEVAWRWGYGYAILVHGWCYQPPNKETPVYLGRSKVEALARIEEIAKEQEKRFGNRELAREVSDRLARNWNAKADELAAKVRAGTLAVDEAAQKLLSADEQERAAIREERGYAGFLPGVTHTRSVAQNAIDCRLPSQTDYRGWDGD